MTPIDVAAVYSLVKVILCAAAFGIGAVYFLLYKL